MEGPSASAATSSSSSSPSFGCRADQIELTNATPVGTGAMGMVYRTTLKADTKAVVVVKILSKIQLLQQSKVESAMNEKAALVTLGPHPFICRLHATAQSDDELYFVMENLPNGDLLEHIRTVATNRIKEHNGNPSEPSKSTTLPVSGPRCLDFHDIQLITAQIVLGLARVFEKGFALRDLKPENVAFDSSYRACLLDFDTIDLKAPPPESNGGEAVKSSTTQSDSLEGLDDKEGGPASQARKLTVSKIQAMRRMTAQFCGTAQYVSPEMLGACKWSFSSDLWALGVMVYQMMYGVEPFRGPNAFLVMREIVKGINASKTHFPAIENLGPEKDGFQRVKTFILDLLKTDPVERLGVDRTTKAFDLKAIQSHSLFSDFDWQPLMEQQEKFHFTSYFDPNASSKEEKHDTPASLKAAYHILPVHSDSYSEYVFEASADVNPFERWMKALYTEPHPTTSTESDKTTSVTSTVTATKPSRPLTGSRTPMSEAGANKKNDKDEDEDDDVIDDVGVRQYRQPKGVFD